MRAVLDVIMLALNLYWWVIIISAILSWLVAFNVVNPRNQVVGTIGQVVHNLTEPALRPIRRFLPNMGGIDLSPIVLLFGIFFLQQLIVRYAYPNVF
ncbi:YggT family protein [Ahrensia marina]|jgi:YggT family protein|uniref:YggT family protein n=1 Tax=Ahrensia marina TaxID=1514904 RepID=UPI0035D0A7BF